MSDPILPDVHIPDFEMNDPVQDAFGIKNWDDQRRSMAYLINAVHHVYEDAHRLKFPEEFKAQCLHSDLRYTPDSRTWSSHRYAGKNPQQVRVIARSEREAALPMPSQIGPFEDMDYESQLALKMHPKYFSFGGMSRITDVPAQGDIVGVQRPSGQPVGTYKRREEQGYGSIPNLKSAEIASGIVESYFKKPSRRIIELSEYEKPTQRQTKDGEDKRISQTTGLPQRVVAKLTC